MRNQRESGDTRANSKLQKGQKLAVDYYLMPEIIIDNDAVGKLGGLLGGFIGDSLGALGGSGLGGLGAFSKTPEGKATVTAFIQPYNSMVIALREYKAQDVEGGLGRGGD